MLGQAVILAGGKGTRLQSRLAGRPKPLVDVLGVPLLERQLLSLKAAGIGEAIVLVNHEAAQIERFCESHANWGMRLALVNDGRPRGTAGAVLKIRERLAGEFLVVYGDTLFDVDLERFYAFHRADPAAGASLLLHPNDHPHDSDLVQLDGNDVITAFHPYPHPEDAWLPNLVNAAMYIVRRKLLFEWTPEEKPILDFAKDFFPWMLTAGARLRGYRTPEYIKDIGTPERLDRASEALRQGNVERSSLSVPQKAVFLDRDGCLNVANGHISVPEQLEVFPFAGAAVRLLNTADYRTVLVTNQPVLARGECTARGLATIHAKLETILGRAGAYLDRIYVCPHHPHRGFPNEVPALKVECSCRKPKPGMLLEASRDLNIDLNASWMIGDGDADVIAGRAAGVTTVLVRGGARRRTGVDPCDADFEFDDIDSAARFIAIDYQKIAEGLHAILVSGHDLTNLFVAGESARARAIVAAVMSRELRLRQMTAVRAPLAGVTVSGSILRRDADEAHARIQEARTALAASLRLRPDTVIWEGVAAEELGEILGLSDRCVLVSDNAVGAAPHTVVSLQACDSYRP